MSSRDELGGTLASGGTLTTKNSGFWVSKVQIFGAKGAENFEKIEVFKEKLTIFCSFRGKFGRILIDIVILDQFGFKDISLAYILDGSHEGVKSHGKWNFIALNSTWLIKTAIETSSYLDSIGFRCFWGFILIFEGRGQLFPLVSLVGQERKIVLIIGENCLKMMLLIKLIQNY